MQGRRQRQIMIIGNAFHVTIIIVRKRMYVKSASLLKLMAIKSKRRRGKKEKKLISKEQKITMVIVKFEKLD